MEKIKSITEIIEKFQFLKCNSFLRNLFMFLKNDDYELGLFLPNSDKKLIFGISRTGGRNSVGRITAYRKGGGNKRKYRMIDFVRDVHSFGLVLSIEYDSNRSAFIALLFYCNGSVSYIIATDGLKIGDVVFSGDKVFGSYLGDYIKDELLEGKTKVVVFNWNPKYQKISMVIEELFWKRFGLSFKIIIKLASNRVGKVKTAINEKDKDSFSLLQHIYTNGSALPLKYIPLGSLVSNVELYPGSGSKLARAAGMYVVILHRKWGKVLLKLRSGLRIFVSEQCFAVLGRVSNTNHKYMKLFKAGTSRHLGRRPVVRGVAMNPVDHPHGGGDGKTSGAAASKTPWGKLTKSTPTVNRPKVIMFQTPWGSFKRGRPKVNFSSTKTKKKKFKNVR